MGLRTWIASIFAGRDGGVFVPTGAYKPYYRPDEAATPEREKLFLETQRSALFRLDEHAETRNRVVTIAYHSPTTSKVQSLTGTPMELIERIERFATRFEPIPH